MPVIVLAATENGFDWTKLIGIPAAAVAVLAIIAYFVGFIHPIAVQDPSYWHDGDRTRVTVAIKNRSLKYDRNVEGIVVHKVPGFLKRTFAAEVANATADRPLRSLGDSACAEQSRLSFGHGAPLRLRNQNQLGFKQVKWIKGIEFVAHFSEVGGGYGATTKTTSSSATDKPSRRSRPPNKKEQCGK